MPTSPNRFEEQGMEPESGSWMRVQEAFFSLLEIDGEAERESYLLQTLADAPALVEEVRAMVRAHETGAPLEIEKRLLNEGPAADLMIGTNIGPYRLERLLGRGGMGEVYLAERSDHQFQHQVAVKLLRAGWHSADALARFRLERQILAKLNHPLIAPLLDGGLTEDGRPYLVLQYVKGLTITDFCNANDFSLEGRLALFCEVARAIEYAHRNLVVHRDLKPGNILVSGDGQVRLLDFGVAKLLDISGEIEVPATRTESRIMTPEYAAPEQILGNAVTTATDVHALGVLMYELLTGVRPYSIEGERIRELERRIVEQDATPPSHAAPKAKRLRGDLDTIVLKALEKQPERRYPSAEQMARDVERYLAGEPVEARAPSVSYRFGKLVRRNRVASALAAVCLLLVFGFALVASYQSRRIIRERDAARSEQVKTEKVVSMLVDLFAASNPKNNAKGKELTVGEFLKITEGAIVGDASLEAGVRVRLKHLLGQMYMTRGEYQSSRAILRDALEQSRLVNGGNGAETAGILHDQARLAMESDAPAKAIPLLRDSLARHRLLFGNRSEKVAACLVDLGWVLPVSDERRALLAESLAIRQALGLAPGIASSLSALGAYYLIAGNLPQAERHYVEALRTLKQIYPEGHPASFDIMSDLATVYNQEGQPDRSAQMNMSLIELKSRLIGPESLPVAINYGNLGVALVEAGDLGKGEDAFRHALDLLIKLFGPDHQQVANGTRNLGIIRRLQGNYGDAAELLRRAVDIQRRLGGDPAALWMMEGQLGVVVFRQGYRAEALNRLKTAVSKLRSLAPNARAAITTTEVSLGFALLESGGAGEAEALLRDALEFRTTTLPKGHPKLSEAECGIGWALALRGKFSEAEILLSKALPVYSAWTVADRVLVDRLQRQLGSIQSRIQ